MAKTNMYFVARGNSVLKGAEEKETDGLSVRMLPKDTNKTKQM